MTRQKGIALEDFKKFLDQYLENIPDQPKIDGLTPGTQDYSGNYSNSILHQTKRGTIKEEEGAMDLDKISSEPVGVKTKF